MKKIYLDLNIISHIEDVQGLYEFIQNNKNHFIFVFSPAHFSDLMNSFQENGNNGGFEKDLERLGVICETHLMRYYDRKLNIYVCSPMEFLEKEGKGYPLSKYLLDSHLFGESLKIGELDLYNVFCECLRSIDFGKTIELPLFGAFSNALEFLNCTLSFIGRLMTDSVFVKTIKKGIANNIDNNEIANINNYDPKTVIGAINAYLARNGIDVDLEEIIKKTFNEKQQGNQMLVFESLYSILDILQYHSDKKDLMNTITDADHAFYGSFCDVLVTEDAKMTYKTEAVYSYFGIETKIIRKEELLDYLIKELQCEQDLRLPFKELLINKRIPKEFDNNIEYSSVVLEHPFLSYYNIMEYQVLKSTGLSYFLFARDLKIDKFIFYTETDKMFQIVKSFLCDPIIVEAFEKDFVEKYYSNDRSAGFRFKVSNKVLFSIGMSENEEYPFPLMTMLLSNE